MQIGRDPAPNRIGRSRILPQQRCCSKLRLASVVIERRWQDGSAFGDKREQSGNANRCDEKKMYSEPSRINALRNHPVDAKRRLRLRRLFSAFSSKQGGSSSPSSMSILADGPG